MTEQQLGTIETKPHGEDVQALIDEVRRCWSEASILRYLLWLRHGCDGSALYGDDGLMDCNRCIISFRTDSGESIQARFRAINEPRIAEYLASPEFRALREKVEDFEGFRPGLKA